MKGIDGGSADINPTGRLGVHSVDRLVFSAPDLKVAEHFYTTFGLSSHDELHGFGLSTRDSPHRPVSVIEGKRKSLHHVRFGAFENDLPAFAARLQARAVTRVDPPAGIRQQRPLVPRSRRDFDRGRGRRKIVAVAQNTDADRIGAGGDTGRTLSQNGRTHLSDAPESTYCCSLAISTRLFASTRRFSGCVCPTGPDPMSPSCMAFTAATIISSRSCDPTGLACII